MSASGSVQQDPSVEPNTGNTVKVKWTDPQDGKPPPRSIGVSLDNAEPFIIQRKSKENWWIVTKFPSDTEDSPQEESFFLVGKPDDVHWVDYNSTDGMLPSTRILCLRTGQYKNMYVGLNGKELGMIVNYEEEIEERKVKKWVFYTDNIEQRIDNGFQILCGQTNKKK